MSDKRETLKKITSASVLAAFMPNSWTKPVANIVLLPAHAQMSTNQAPIISDISCNFDTPTLQIGSVITMEASITSVASPIEDISWRIQNSNGGIIARGDGQFTTTTYTALPEDIGNLVLQLEVFDGPENTSIERLCDSFVNALPPEVTAIVSGSPRITEVITANSVDVVGDFSATTTEDLIVDFSVEGGTILVNQTSARPGEVRVDQLDVRDIAGILRGFFVVTFSWTVDVLVNDVTVQDNAGLSDSSAGSISVNGSNVRQDLATYSILSDPTGGALSINPDNLELIWRGNVSGNQTFNVTVQVEYPLGLSGTDTFVLTVIDSG